MILRVDSLQTALPPPSELDPAGASAVQELAGGKVRRDVHRSPTGPVAGEAAGPMRSLRLRQQVGVAPQVKRPAVAAGNAVADALPALAVAVEVAVLEFDAGALGRLGDEAHLPFARPRGI